MYVKAITTNRRTTKTKIITKRNLGGQMGQP